MITKTYPLFSELTTMTIANPYVENLIEMGYDRADCETVAACLLYTSDAADE